EPPLKLVDDLADDEPCRLASLRRNHAVEGKQRSDEVHVRLDGLEQLRLEQELVQAEALDRVLLHDAHDRRRGVLANVAPPARDARRRGVEAAAARPTGSLVVERSQGRVELRVATGERRAGTVVGAAE